MAASDTAAVAAASAPGSAPAASAGAAGRKIEYRPAVIGEVNPVLAAGDVDAMRQEEVCTDQHVGVEEVDVAEAQLCVLNLLISDLEAREARDPGLRQLVPQAV